ncbi:MAG: hypothetical protein ACAI38_17290 [Myxococcota bacterium]|nr:hypothetical protein [Myxococcota bacterium]
MNTRFFTACIGVGLALETIELASFGPGSFVAFALLGIPLIALGVGYFAMHVVRLALRGGA